MCELLLLIPWNTSCLEISSARSTLKKCTVLSSISVLIDFKLILEPCTTSGVYFQLYQTSMMKVLAIVFSQKLSIIDIWRGSKYGSAALFLNNFLLSLVWYLSEYINISSGSLKLVCSCDVNQKYYLTFHWFPNHLWYIDHGNTKFSYIYAIEIRKSSLGKTSRSNSRLIHTINKNINNNKNQARITKAFL